MQVGFRRFSTRVAAARSIFAKGAPHVFCCLMEQDHESLAGTISRSAAFVTKGYGILRKYDEFYVCIVCVMHESSECIQDRGGPGRHVCWYGCLSSLWYSGLLLTGGCKEKQAALGHS
jgi:hypothetical protein